MRSPADASPAPSRAQTHGLGPMWIATPSSHRTCTDYSLPVSRRTIPSAPPGSRRNVGERKGSPRLATPSRPAARTSFHPSQWIRPALSSTNSKQGPNAFPHAFGQLARGKIHRSLLGTKHLGRQWVVADNRTEAMTTTLKRFAVGTAPMGGFVGARKMGVPDLLTSHSGEPRHGTSNHRALQTSVSIAEGILRIRLPQSPLG